MFRKRSNVIRMQINLIPKKKTKNEIYIARERSEIIYVEMID